MAQNRQSRKIVKLGHIPPTFWLKWIFKLNLNEQGTSWQLHFIATVMSTLQELIIPFLTYTFLLLNFLWYGVPQLSFTLPGWVLKLVLSGQQKKHYLDRETFLLPHPPTPPSKFFFQPIHPMNTAVNSFSKKLSPPSTLLPASLWLFQQSICCYFGPWVFPELTLFKLMTLFKLTIVFVSIKITIQESPLTCC